VLHSYWAWVGGNIGAMPLEATIGAIAAFLARRPLARAVNWFRRESSKATQDALLEARLARRIAADLYRETTGREHEHAPAGE
jgi:hypothetical protein